MQTTLLILLLLISFGIFMFVGVIIFEMKNEADHYLKLKKTAKDPLPLKKHRFVKKLSNTQLNILLNALKN